MVFYSDSGSFSDVEISGSMKIYPPGTFEISGSQGPLMTYRDILSDPNVFTVTSASIDLFKVNVNKEVHVSGSIVITGSAFTGSINLPVIVEGSTNTISQLVFSNSNRLSFGLNGSTVTATWDPNIAFSYLNPLDAYNQVAGTFGNGSLFMQPVQFAKFVDCDRIAFPVFMSNAANNNSSVALTLSMRFGLYTRSVSALNLLTNLSTVLTFQSTLSTANSSIYHGLRLWTTAFSKELSEGQYYAAILSNQTTANQPGTIQNIVVSQLNSSFWGMWGEAANQTAQYTRGLGIYSTTTNNLPSSIAFSQIRGAATGTGGANTTQTIVLRQPIFYLVSQTF